MTTNAVRRIGGALLAGTMALGLAACAETEAGDKEISIGYIPPWSDTRVAAALMTYKAEELGYEVEWEDVGEPPLLFAGVAEGDIDVYASAWAERNHAAFMNEFGDQLEDLGAYYEGAGNFLAVPEYSEITSIDEIPDHAEALDGRIIGIEAGAGLTKQVQEDVLPAYGLDQSMEFVTSSTTAMLAELKGAIDSEEEIVVTLWAPYWAATEFNVRPLEDPQGAFGETEGMHYVATAGFSEEHPEIAQWVSDFLVDEEEFASLENMILNEYEEGEELEAVEAWLEDHPDVFDE